MLEISNPPRWIEALLDPGRYGFPLAPWLRVPAIIWIRHDPSPEARAFVAQIWATLPPKIQQECRNLFGWEL